MGELEERTRKRRKKANIKLAILLGLVGGATVAGYAALGPAILAGFSVLKTPVGKSFTDGRTKRSLRSLLESGLVVFKNKNGNKYLELTGSGRAYLRKKRLAGYDVPKPKRWDGKWRVVIFDIKEVRRNRRDLFRSELKAVGFVRLQHSVWIYPYDCEDLVMLIKSDYKLGGNVVYLIAEEIENDGRFRKQFGLF